jgi:saccharopine dehydrogenase (NAD+, L-lysine-forming)
MTNFESFLGLFILCNLRASLSKEETCMLKIGLIREGKYPADNRVALIPSQCKWIHKTSAEIKIVVQSSDQRCFSDKEYVLAGVEVKENLAECDILLGIKETPPERLMEGKTYLFFSHTKKKQPHNRHLLQTIIQKNITLIDYECLEHEDGQRIIGFGFFAGIVGAHNGMMAYGKRTGLYELDKVHNHKSFQLLIHTYFGLRLPVIKIAVTGSGRVASGIIEIMNPLGIIEVEPDEYLGRSFTYPVYVHLKGADLYTHKDSNKYNREDFHINSHHYTSTFKPYLSKTDILMNGVYWDTDIPRLFEWQDMMDPDFQVQTIADITDDHNGSIPCNIGDASISDPVYGVDKLTHTRTAPYLKGSIDMMAVSNLPNELPRDASRYFGEQLIKYVLEDLVKGKLTSHFSYLQEYAAL